MMPAMDHATLPLPPASADFIGGDTPRSHRSHLACGYTLDQMRYNCRVSRAKELAAAEAAKPAPLRDAQARILDLLQ